MANYALRRLLGVIPVVLGLSVLAFLMLHFIPGDPAEVVAGLGASNEDIMRIRHNLGLDRPLHVQYFDWLKNAVQGDWGRSIVTREPVFGMLMDRFRNTLLLAAAGIFVAVSVAVPLGVLAALRRNSGWDFGSTVFALAGVSAPIFWISLLLQFVFSVKLGWLPATGNGSFLHLVLPAIAIGANSTGVIMRMTRSSVLEVIQQDYIRTARAKGLAPKTVTYRHALRNAAVPIVTVIGLQSATLMGGAVLTETVFMWPGIGKLIVDSIFRRDFPMVQGAVIVTGIAFVVVNTVVDLAYGMLDPRVRVE